MHMSMSTSAKGSILVLLIRVFLILTLYSGSSIAAKASDFHKPWRDKQKAIVIDAYEKNPIDWLRMVSDKRISGFIGKSSDGLASPWSCSGNTTKRQLCKKSFQNYWMKQQLYHTRKLVAKQLGLKWGAYHLGRPGNPVAQADHFINFTKPEADDLIALDIEHDDPKKWISFKDAEIFVKHVYKRIGRYPVLYTNHDTAKRIAARRDEFPILSRLHLWYARFKSDIRGAFPMGNWETYSLWQFSARPNCNKRRCNYRVPGTQNDIDVNISTLSIKEFDKAWPFNGLVPERAPKPEVLLVKNETPTINTQSENVDVASLLPISSIQVKEDLSEEASFQIASIDLKNIAIPVARKRDDVELVEVIKVAKTETSNDIIISEIEPEYEVVIPKSEHAEDLTMQLQYLSGAL